MAKLYPSEMHSLEHILNGTMVQLFGCQRAFGSHIESKKSKCDYRFDRNLTEQEVEELTQRVNSVVEQNLPITDFMMPRAEAESRFNLERLPEDAGDELRIVGIGEYDYCPCIGQHASNTAELGYLRIVSTDYADGVLRVRFKMAPR